jgi:hypothetical protein
MNEICSQIELPFQGACLLLSALYPKALPWADITWAFSQGIEFIQNENRA